MKQLTCSICIPVYKGSRVLKNALTSVLAQEGVKFECLIADDNEPFEVDEIKKTKQIISSFHDSRIRYVKNMRNLGYPRTMKQLFSHAKNDIIFLMAQDDILAENALKKTLDAFSLDDNVGAVTRPYFWFEKDIKVPVRAIIPPSRKRHTLVSFKDDPYRMLPGIIESVGQLSGLAMHRNLITSVVHEEHVFTCHVYPFLSILKRHNIVYLKDYTVAVRIEESQSRHVSAIYDISPTKQWMELLNTIFRETEYKQFRDAGKEYMLKNYVGLVQLKNYASFQVLWSEIMTLVKYRPLSVLSPSFWFFSILSITMPRHLLTRLTDWYKRTILSRQLPSIQFRKQN
ncbi:glycosyltransferase family 2 protein [Candidatus Woesebacteria bacterium]|nr:glycosyltransferase family 2 protein [Candidatus Woesebacteria bacterium]